MSIKLLPQGCSIIEKVKQGRRLSQFTMSHDPMITVAANCQRIQSIYQEEVIRKSAEAFRYYLDKMTGLELPYSSENLYYLTNIISNMTNMLNVQKSSIVSSLILLQSTQSVVNHLLVMVERDTTKPKPAKERRKTKQNLPATSSQLPSLPHKDVLSMAMKSANIDTFY